MTNTIAIIAEGPEDLFHSFGDRECLVERNGIVDVLREALLHLSHELPDTCDRLHSIASRQKTGKRQWQRWA